MRGKRKISGQNWEFDGSTITVRIPMTWKRRGGRKVIIAPDGGDAWAPAKPRPDETLIRALARAHRWKRMLEEGRYRSAGGAGRSGEVSRELRQPAAAAHPSRAGDRRGNFGGAAAEGDASAGYYTGDAECVGRANKALFCELQPFGLRS